MTTRSLKITWIPATLFILMMLIVSLSCSLMNVGLSGGGTQITIELKEDDINRMLQQRYTHQSDGLFSEINGVDIQDGLIRVFGDAKKADGSMVSGSYDAVLKAENGALKAEITAVDIEGLSIDDPKVLQTNQELADELGKAADEGQGVFEFESVSLGNDVLKIVIKIGGSK
jgi:hypothetical protein